MQIPQQQSLNLFSVAEKVIDGLPIGVLNDGTPYVSIRGMATLCGIDHAVIVRLMKHWDKEQLKPRGQKILEILQSQNYNQTNLYIQASNGHRTFPAIPDAVCMALLEYYAFSAEQANTEIAKTNFRILARASFKLYVYEKCEYNPNQNTNDSWQAFHERLLLNDNIPLGYFSIFKELSGVILSMIREGCKIDDSTVPDISVGQIWTRYWTQNNFNEKYGERFKFPHVYPDTFRQSSGGEYEAWVYPADALGIFRQWLHEVYLIEKFPKYLNTKVTSGAIINADADKLLDVLQKPALNKLNKPK